MKKLIVSLMLMAGVSACQTVKMPEYQVGQQFENEIVIGGAGNKVPLPEGKWDLVSLEYNSGSYLGGWNDAVLVKIENNELKGIISAWGPNANASWGYNPAKVCEDKDMLFLAKRYNTQGGVQDCRYVNNWEMYFTTRSSKGWRDVFTYLEEKKIDVPVNMISVGYRKANKTRLLSVNYAFNPEAEGFDAPKVASWKDGDWSKSGFQSDPKKVEFIDKLKDWSAEWDTKVNEAFGGYLAL